MTDSLSQRVQQLGLRLPEPSQPIANYVNHVVSQNQLFISGQIPLLDGKPAFIGRLGEAISDEEGVNAAELAALGLLAQSPDERRFAVEQWNLPGDEQLVLADHVVDVVGDRLAWFGQTQAELLNALAEGIGHGKSS